jgi:hypothetical protein
MVENIVSALERLFGRYVMAENGLIWLKKCS